MEFAPILVSVYNRKEHFKKCIEALAQNDLAKESDLFIVSDAANKPEDENLIQDIRGYIYTIDGFKSINLIERKENLGSYLSIKNAIDEVLTKYDKLIFLEDDIITSRYFLHYMNSGLSFYANNTKVFSISGYSFPIKLPIYYKKETYVWSRFNAWGVGIWKNKWELIDFSLSDFNSFLENKKSLEKFNKISELTLKNIIALRSDNYVPIDSAIGYNLFKLNMFNIYPNYPLSLSIGCDGSGEHCLDDPKINSQILHSYKSPPVLIRNPKKDFCIYRRLAQYFSQKKSKTLKETIERLYVFAGTRIKYLFKI